MISTDTATDIAKYLPHLAREYDGEIATVVRRIGRILADAGNDWHDLAYIVMEGAKAEDERIALSPLPDVPAAAAQAPVVPDVAPAAPDAPAAHDASTAPDAPDAPDAPAQTCGMKIWGDDDDDMAPWSIVADQALTFNWCLPKARGGRFLTKVERDRLRVWVGGGSLTNADAAWLSSVFERLNAARRSHPNVREAA